MRLQPGLLGGCFTTKNYLKGSKCESFRVFIIIIIEIKVPSKHISSSGTKKKLCALGKKFKHRKYYILHSLLNKLLSDKIIDSVQKMAYCHFHQYILNWTNII